MAQRSPNWRKGILLGLSPEEKAKLKVAAVRDRRPLTEWIRLTCLDAAEQQGRPSLPARVATAPAGSAVDIVRDIVRDIMALVSREDLARANPGLLARMDDVLSKKGE